MRGSVRRVMVLVAVVVLGASLTAGQAGAAPPGPWSAAWSASAQAAASGFTPNWSEEGFADQTVRQIVRLSSGGPAARIRVSNVYGDAPLRITGATVARAAEGAAIRPESLRHLTFHGARDVVVPAGAELFSDPVPLRTEPLASLAVTLYFAEPTGPAPHHAQAAATSYRAAGERLADADGAAFTDTTQSWYYLSAVDVLAPPRGNGIATFGDSITDGAASTPEANNRYPDELAEILAARGKPRGVVNAGIGGNRLVNDSDCFGESGVNRFARDVLGQSGLGSVVVLEGINDIQATESGWACFTPLDPVPAAELIAAHRQLIAEGHANGLRMIGATTLPYGGSMLSSPRGEAVRDEVNTWIRESGAYDTVVDLDRVMADPADPDRINPAYDSGDGLHPGDVGYHAMAEAVAGVIKR